MTADLDGMAAALQSIAEAIADSASTGSGAALIALRLLSIAEAIEHHARAVEGVALAIEQHADALALIDRAVRSLKEKKTNGAR